MDSENLQIKKVQLSRFRAVKKVGPMWGRYTGSTRKVKKHEANLMMKLMVVLDHQNHELLNQRIRQKI